MVVVGNCVAVVVVIVVAFGNAVDVVVVIVDVLMLLFCKVAVAANAVVVFC